jgi:uncharacterized protein (DUF736 family)
MEERDDTNRFALFHEPKNLNEKAPTLKGWLNIKGTKYRISAWERTSKGGKDYISGSVDSEELSHENNT